MNRLVKTISFVAACLLLLTQLAIFGSFAAEGSLDDHMIVHYDFEGATQEEQLKDKATAGSVSDDLTVVKNATVADGVASIAVDGVLKTAAGGDVALLGNTMTVYMELRAEYVTAQKWANFFAISTGSNLWGTRMAFNPDNNSLYTFAASTSANMPLGFDGEWIRLAYSLNYDANAKSAAATLYWSVDGGITWKSIGGTQSGDNYQADFSSAKDIQLGMGLARGLSLQFDDLRIYDKVLTADEIKAVSGTVEESEVEKSDDERLLLHYDFQGETAAERLANKGYGQTESLSMVGNTSYVKDGVAYVSSAQGNYLIASVGEDVKTCTSATLFTVFRAEGSNPSNAGDVAQIGSTVRLAMDTGDKLFTRLGSGILNNAATQKGVPDPVARDLWIYVVITVEYLSDGSVREVVYVSTDEGENYTSYTYEISDVSGMFIDASDLLLGKVSKTIGDRGTSFYYRDVRLYNTVIEETEFKSFDIQEVELEPAPSIPDEGIDNEDLSAHLVVHYDFLGDTMDEKMRDKGTAGVSREDLMMYSSLDENGNKLSYLENRGTVYVSSKQSNLLFAMAGEDITSIKKSMTVFAVFQAHGDNSTNPCAIAAMDNTLRFSFHNVNSIFIKVGPEFAGAGASTAGNMPRGPWIYAATTLTYDEATGTVQTKLYVSLDGGKTYTMTQGTASGIASMFSETSYLCFGKLSPGMDDRGTDFRYKDIRVYDCALTLSELQGIVVEEYKEPAVTDPSDKPAEDTGKDPSDTENATVAPDTTSESPVTGTEQSSESGLNCGASLAGVSAVWMITVLAVGAVAVKKRRA